MATVFLCSPNNSTMFTTCCEVAVCDDQNRCPRCQQEVLPQGRSERWETAYGPIRRNQRWYGNWYPNHGEGRGHYERQHPATGAEQPPPPSSPRQP
ncbi:MULTISPECIES: hypothetical protein [unclassified Pseudomonas]|uniref:hypothetical protein n=1 Tax=unclassified Pseudomonas TaxID=196821 RepID=UPI00244C32E6|nr:MULTISPECIES: hypothetical protein [unclassified Pseudomonas]MDG9927460.1 hypothetical protein [Pseudomonas sp. GD04042]MDH0482529.1 hypothetical protein [Pseudomonas sp. GD04015]MDH0602881.1 hypothetical protein [Pseudomonas sp. GD03869]